MATKKFRKNTRPFMPHRHDRRDAEGDNAANAEMAETAKDEAIESGAGVPGDAAGETSNAADASNETGCGCGDSRESAENDGGIAGDDSIQLPPEGEEIEEPVAAGIDEELATLRRERDAYLDMARRERADFDNYRKRMERDLAAMKRESLAGFLKEFFRPLDDMDRVLLESEKNHSFESLVTGVRIMEENFWRVLAKAGVRKMDAMGKQFNPELHEAMAAIPSADVPPNTILEVFENGYKLDDHVLRPARVVVSREP